MRVEVVKPIHVFAKRFKHMARFTRVHVRLDLVFPQKVQSVGFESVVFCHEQVEVSVVVDVHPGGSPAELVQSQVVLCGFLGEVAVFLLDKKFGSQPVSPKPSVGVVQVLASVLVEVAQRQGHCVNHNVGPEVRCDVNEGAISLIFKHGVRAPFVVDDQQILVTIFVEIPPRALKAQTHVDVNARFFRHVGEVKIPLVAQEDISQSIFFKIRHFNIPADVQVQIAIAIHVAERCPT